MKEYEFKIDRIETRFVKVPAESIDDAYAQVYELDGRLNHFRASHVNICHELLNIYEKETLDSKGIQTVGDRSENEDEPIYFKRLNDGFQIPIRKGAFYDLFNPSTIVMEPEEISVKIHLGFACKLPAGHFAIVAARSSLYDRLGLQLANGIRIIDDNYCGDSDEWILNLKRSDRAGQIVIESGIRLAQFGIFTVAKDRRWEEVQTLNASN